MARRATIIDRERAAAEHLLLLDAGAFLLNDEEPALSARGGTSVLAYNKLGYDAVTLGGLDIAMLTVDELLQHKAEAQFALLSANATISATDELLAEPYLLRQVADHSVAILGLTDEYPDDEVRIGDPLEAARKWVPELRQQADIVILLSHLGIDADEQLAARIPGIDLIVSGRNFSMAAPKVVESTGTVLFHSDYAMEGTAGTRIGVAKLSFDASGALTAHEWTNVLLDTSVDASPAMLEWLSTVIQ